MERVEVLNTYYTNLDYDKKEEELIRKKILVIYHTMYNKFTPEDHMSTRLWILIDTIYNNLPIFSSIFKHIDIIYNILSYINQYNTLIVLDNLPVTDSGYELNDLPAMLVTTLLNICTGTIMHSLLIDCLIAVCKDIIDQYDGVIYSMQDTDTLIICTSEMVILEDSDLHAVINCLMITAEQFPLHKIWVQERVSEKLLWLMKSFHFELSVTIDTFQSVKDIQFYQPKRCVNVTIISIWSEDIVAAKNLALSLKSHLVFINKYMDFYGSTVLWPFKSMLFQHLLYKELTIVSQEDETIGQSKEFSRNVVHLSSVIKTNDISIGNLFYDGAWQTPIKGMYWKHNGSLWAQTTCDDFQKCYKSAVNGLQTWSAMSIKTRIQILSRLVSVLKSTGKFVLAAIVERWIKFPYLYNSIQGFIKSDMIEVMQTRESLGVIIILKEESENVLFFRLMQTLISGNPVIVIFDANFCNPSSYFDMFLMCEIPPGVINLLSHEDVSTLEYKLCLDNYTNYVNEIFLKGTSLEAYILPFKRLTIPKQIIISLQ